jgi:hypothetical protein
MNRTERETHTLDTLDTLDALNFMSDGLQGLAELLQENDPNARPCELVANRHSPRGRVGLRGLFLPLAATAAKLLTGD